MPSHAVFAVGLWMRGHAGVCRRMSGVRPSWCSPWDIRHDPALVFAPGRWGHSRAGVVCQLAAGGCCCLCSRRQLPAIREPPPGALPSQRSAVQSSTAQRSAAQAGGTAEAALAFSGSPGPSRAGKYLPCLSLFRRKEGNRMGRDPGEGVSATLCGERVVL